MDYVIPTEELETLEIKADKKLLLSILRAEDDIRKGRLFSHKDVYKKLSRKRW